LGALHGPGMQGQGSAGCAVDLMISEKQLGATVRELRKAAGLSQRELAETSGIAKQAITNIERGATLPTLRTLEQLAVALHVPPSEVLRRAEGQTRAGDGTLDGQQRDLWNSLDPDSRSLALSLLRTIANWSSKAKHR
jgi:transcriptional regulator with XRE-family HTH domain